MKYLILFLIISLNTYSQKNTDISLSNKNTIDTVFDCYNGTQLEMNICSYNEFMYYDSIVNLKYKNLLNLINTRLKEEKEYQELFEYNQTLLLKETLISSQKVWNDLKNENTEIIKILYEGGSMKPMVINIQAINDIKNRIEFIEKLINNEK